MLDTLRNNQLLEIARLILGKLNNKVDKVEGKQLSTEDYTTAEKTKLNGIETEANKTIVDSAINANSSNPVQNSVISTELNNKVDKVEGKQLSTEDFTSDEKSKLANIEPEANKTIVDNSITLNSNNPVTSNAIYLNTTIVIDFTSTNNYGPFNKNYWIGKIIEEKYHSTVTKIPSQYTRQEYENQTGEQVDYDEIVNFIITASPSTFQMNNPVIVIIDLETFEDEPIKYIAVKGNGVNYSYLIRRLGSSSYIEKSSTQGLIKNDGTIDTNQYLTSNDIPESFNYGYVDSNLVLHLTYIESEISSTNAIIQSGDDTTITAVISDKDGNLLEDMPVEFFVDGVKYGQTVNTNANGVASFTYTGTGAGAVDVQVRIGSFQSEIYETLDCIIYDKAITGSKNSSVTFDSNTLSEEVGDEYTTLSTSSANSNTGRYKYNTDLTGDFEAIVTAKADPLENVGLSIISFGVCNSSLNNQYSISDFDNQNDWIDLKLTRVNGEYTFKYKSVNSDNWTIRTLNPNNATDDSVNIVFYIYTASQFCKLYFKDLKVYPI